MFSPLPGRDGKILRLYKFRTMTGQRDENGRLYKVIKKSDIQAGSEIKAGRLDVVISGSNDKTV